MKFLNYKNYGRLWTVYGRSLLYYSTPKKLFNLFRTEMAYRRRAVDVKSMPFTLFVEPLYYCNLECPLCDRQFFADARPGKEAGKLPLDLFDRILEQAGDYILQCQIYGQGEPLLDWPRTKSIIQKAHARRIFTLLSTNSTLATPAIAEDLVTSGLDHLVCAIDGISQESYSKYRFPGNFNDAFNGMKYFAEARKKARAHHLHIEWQFLVNKFNQHEMAGARKLAHDLGVQIRFSPIRGMEFEQPLQDTWLPTLTPMYAAADAAPGQSVYSWPCYFLWRSLILNSNGKAPRCLIFENVSEFASYHDLSVREIYNHPTTQRARQLFSKGKVPDGDFPAPCNNCSFYARHHGGKNLDKWGATNRPKPASSQFIPATSLTVNSRQPTSVG